MPTGYKRALGMHGIYCPSLVPRPLYRRRKDLVHTARACAGVSIATGRVTIEIVRGFCMTYCSMDDKRRVYDSIRLPHIFLGSPAHAHALCTRPFLLLLYKGLGTRLLLPSTLGRKALGLRCNKCHTSLASVI